MILFVFVRKGCCICDALKNNLSSVNLKNINPNLKINEIDIDRFDLYQDMYKKYDYQVPVMGVKALNSDQIIELPRVSPRLKNLHLENWLEKNINKYIGENL